MANRNGGRVYAQVQRDLNNNEPRTYESIGAFLGKDAYKFGLISSLKPNHTASFLTESLMNVYTNDKKAGKFQHVDSMSFEWDIEVPYYKTVEIISVTQVVGSTRSYEVVFNDNYYNMHDTVVIDDTRQIIIAVTNPVEVTGGFMQVVELIDPDLSETLVPADVVGSSTRWRSTHHPEMSDRGYAKELSNVEKHRNYITLHRSDVYQSARYAATEDTFLRIAKGEGKGDIHIKMEKGEKKALDSFLEARNNSLMWSKSNVDKNGKCTTLDRKTGRPIYIGDGIVPQIERYADITAYAKGTLSMKDLRSAISSCVEKCDDETGNHFTFLCNSILWRSLQVLLDTYMSDKRTNGEFFYSKAKNGNVSVGATFSIYEFGGNFISFKADRSLTKEYPTAGYGIMLDLTPDKTNDQAALSMITLKGSEMITGTLRGLGGANGTTSGDVASPVAGSGYMVMGYSGVLVASPYRSHIFIENIF